MTLINYATGTPTAVRRSNTARLQAAFPGQPALNGYDDAEVAVQMGTLHNGVVSGNPDYPNNSLDYQGVGSTTPPNAADVPTGPGGLPWTAYVPNVISPGPGSVNPADMADPSVLGTPTSSGAGSTRLPGETSPLIADQQKAAGNPGNLIKGSSTNPPLR